MPDLFVSYFYVQNPAVPHCHYINRRYAACADGAEVVAAQNDFLAKEEEERRKRRDEIDLPPTYSSEEEEEEEIEPK